jgi:2-oxoglutarate ferredoxin oxidoreductase subunit gamma
MGKILAYSEVMQNQEVAWFPSYGPEMRGGTANVTVILSVERISSPILNEYDTAIILNQQSMTKFESRVKPGGTLIYDPNGIVKHPTRSDINIYKVEGSRLAVEMGNPLTFNMIVLGAFLMAKPVVKIENVKKGLEKSLPERHHKLIPLNLEAILKGQENLQIVQTV